jgi:predicted lipoprotein with Yx(FWY)xxD motif
MRMRIAVVPLAILALGMAAGCGSGSSDDQAAAPASGYGAPPPTTAPEAGPATVSTATGDLGTFLVGPDGRTLYLFEKDTGMESTCSGACASAWPPLLTTGAPAAAGEATAGLLGTTARDDGTVGVTYAGHPLYYYAGDTAPGDTNGQELDDYGAEWYVIAPSGKALEGDES